MAADDNHHALADFVGQADCGTASFERANPFSAVARGVGVRDGFALLEQPVGRGGASKPDAGDLLAQRHDRAFLFPLCAARRLTA
jgi:hypothetical protein